MVATSVRKSSKKAQIDPDDTRERRLEKLGFFNEGDRVFWVGKGKLGVYKGIQDLPMPSAWVIFDGSEIHEPINPLHLVKQPTWKKGDIVVHEKLGRGVVRELTRIASFIDFEEEKLKPIYHATNSLKLADESVPKAGASFGSDIQVGDEVSTNDVDDTYKVVSIENGQAEIWSLSSGNVNKPSTRQLPLWHLTRVKSPPSNQKNVQTTLEELLSGTVRVVPSPLVESIEGANNWINLFSGSSLNPEEYKVSWAIATPQTANSFDMPSDFDGAALSGQEVEKLIEQIIENTDSLKSLALFAKNFTRYALVKIDAREGYKAFGCDSMSGFLIEHHSLFKRAYSSLQKDWQAGRLEYDLGLQIGTLPETQARELYPLKDNLGDCKKAWENACEVAEGENRKVKSSDIGVAVCEILNLPEPPKKIKTKCEWVPGPNATRHYKVSLYGKEINLHDTFDEHAVTLVKFAEARKQAPEEIILDGLLGALSEMLGVGNPGAVAAAIDFLKRKEAA